MKHLSEKEYEIRLQKIRERNASIERRNKLKEERVKGKGKRKLPSTSKMVLFGVVAICVQIVIFCEYIVSVTEDTSCLYALIGIPATLAPTVWAYYSKAKAENTEGGITYMTAMAQYESAESEHINEEIESSMDDSVG
ncbi:MAG: hypothetical protein LUG91_00085 [Ruminococcus sp.]|nr:hypothetical protein [Ruminococcus sp.]